MASINFQPQQREEDQYLLNFKNSCLQRFGDNLAALLIYGSFQWGYFDPEKSDYDMWIVFKEKMKIKIKDEMKDKSKDEEHKAFEEYIRQDFPKISLHYILTLDELFEKIKEGSFSNLLTFLTLPEGASVIYSTNDFNNLILNIRTYYNQNKSELRAKMKQRYLEKIDKQLSDLQTGNFQITDKYISSKIHFQSMRLCLQLIYLLKTDKFSWDLDSIRDELNIPELSEIFETASQLWNAVKKREGIDVSKEMLIEQTDTLKEILTDS